MKSTEYFTRIKQSSYTLKGIGSIPVEDHPFSRKKLQRGTRYVQLVTYRGDQTTSGKLFWEQQLPANYAVGPIITLREYYGLLRSVGIPRSLDERKWIDYPTEPLLYSSTFDVVSHVQIPADPADTQVQATTVFQREAPPDVPSYLGTLFIDVLQRKGFPPDSFFHLREQRNSLSIIIKILNLGKTDPCPSGVLRERIRTSRLIPLPC